MWGLCIFQEKIELPQCSGTVRGPGGHSGLLFSTHRTPNLEAMESFQAKIDA